MCCAIHGGDANGLTNGEWHVGVDGDVGGVGSGVACDDVDADVDTDVDDDTDIE